MEYQFTTLEQNLEGILEVAHASFEHFYSTDKLFKKLKDKKHWVQIVKDNKKIVAFQIYYEDDNKELYGWLGAVHPDYRRQNIFTRMLGIQFNIARSLGYSKLKLKTHKGHPEMILLCQKSGFTETRRDPNHWGDGLEAIFFEYELG